MTKFKKKASLRNRTEGVFLYGKESGKFTTYEHAYVELWWLGNTVPHTREHCDILSRDVLSLRGCSQFRRLILRIPPAHMTDILSTLRDDWCSDVTENNTHFLYSYMTPCVLNLLELPWGIMQYTPRILISVCHSIRRSTEENDYLHQYHCENLGSGNTSVERLNCNVEPTIHIA